MNSNSEKKSVKGSDNRWVINYRVQQIRIYLHIFFFRSHSKSFESTKTNCLIWLCARLTRAYRIYNNTSLIWCLMEPQHTQRRRSRVKQKLFSAGFCLPNAQKINSTLVLAVNSIVNPQKKNASVYNKHVFYGFFRTCIKTIHLQIFLNRIRTYTYLLGTYICVLFGIFVYNFNSYTSLRVFVLCLRNRPTICLQVFTVFLVKSMCVVWGFGLTRTPAQH